MLNSRDQSSPGRVRLAEAMNAAAPAVWDWDRLSETFIASNRIYEIYGFPGTVPLTFNELCNATHSLDRGWADELLQGAPRLRHAGLYLYRIRRVDTGEVRWVRTRISVVTAPGDAETVVAYTGTVEDVTDQIRATHALRESEARLRLAIEAGKMALWEVDLEAGTVTNTPDLNLLFGLPEDAKPTFEELRSHYAPGELNRLAEEGATLEVVRARFARGDFKPR
jgi:PAS domain-containing protein